jgi:HEPN domain-containing protein
MVLSLDEITKFNVSTRYDDEKFAFYKKATKEFTEEYFKITEKIYSWIKENYLKT